MITEKEEEKDETEVTETETQPEPKVETTETVDPIEELALEIGWVPKEEFNDDGGRKKWVNARTFIKNEREVGRRQHEIIEKQNEEQQELRQQLREIKNTVIYLRDHQSKITQEKIEKAREELSTAKREAITEGDVDKVEKIEKQLDKVEKDYSEEVENTLPATREPDPEYIKWKNNPENNWYGNDEYLTYIADKVSKENATKVSSMKELLDLVDKAVIKAKSSMKGEKNKNGEGNIPNTTTVAGAGNISSKGSTKKKFTEKDLTFEQMKVAESSVKMGIFKNKQEVIDEWTKTGVLS